MKNIILHILCEGYTEYVFVKDVLKPYLEKLGFRAVKPIIIFTSREKNRKGGLNKYAQAKKDMSVLLKRNIDNKVTKYYFTTMFDMYQLPDDFPGYISGNNDIKKLENALFEDIKDNRFIPYIQLHEFETLIFCGLEYIEDKEIREDLEKIIIHTKPEDINNGEKTAPSKRIITVFERHNEHYNKIKGVKSIVKNIGVDKLKQRTPHFAQWIDKLESCLSEGC